MLESRLWERASKPDHFAQAMVVPTHGYLLEGEQDGSQGDSVSLADTLRTEKVRGIGRGLCDFK